LYRRTDEKYTIERVKARTKPSTVAVILEDVRPVQIERTIPWMRIQLRVNNVVRSVIDKHGVTGFMRTLYYDYWRSLWKFLSKYRENVWDKYVEATKQLYITIHNLDPKILDEATDAILKTFREIFGELEGGGGGGEKVGDSDSGEAVGEA
jgi:hypothetical protein